MENTNCGDDQVRAADGEGMAQEEKTDFKARWRRDKVLMKKCNVWLEA